MGPIAMEVVVVVQAVLVGVVQAVLDLYLE
jgi:hypothetical protein